MTLLKLKNNPLNNEGIALWKSKYFVYYEMYNEKTAYIHTAYNYNGRIENRKINIAELQFIDIQTISDKLIFPEKILTVDEIDKIKSFEELGNLNDLKLYLMQISNIVNHVLNQNNIDSDDNIDTSEELNDVIEPIKTKSSSFGWVDELINQEIDKFITVNKSRAAEKKINSKTKFNIPASNYKSPFDE